MAAGGEPAVGAERDATTEAGLAGGHQLVPLAVATDAEELVVHELLDGERVVDLHEVSIAGAEPGLLVGVGGRVSGHLRRSDHCADEHLAVGVGLRALHQQGRHGEVAGCVAERIDVGAAVTALAREERRVPVPAPAAVLALSQVLPQPVEVGGARSVGPVDGDGVGRLVEAGEAVGRRGHEPHDALDAGRLELGRDVDEDEALEAGGTQRSLAHQPDLPPIDAPTTNGGRPISAHTASRSSTMALVV
jgi:hypothetical protein